MTPTEVSAFTIVIAYRCAIIGGCVYLIGWQGWSAWWVLLALLLLGGVRFSSRSGT